MTSAERPIIAVEDSDEDYFSLVETLRALGVANPVCRCADGRAALDALMTGERCRAHDAALILLDLNMPGVDGRMLLARLREKDKAVPVLVLSTSAHTSDVEHCYAAGANAYLVKPHELDAWQDLLRATVEFWLRKAELPPLPRSNPD